MKITAMLPKGVALEVDADDEPEAAIYSKVPLEMTLVVPAGKEKETAQALFKMATILYRT